MRRPWIVINLIHQGGEGTVWRLLKPPIQRDYAL
jgi:hypothetical protein